MSAVIDQLTLIPCDVPPSLPFVLSPKQRGIEWFRYEVRTASGRGAADGYAPGPRENAHRRAVAALNSLQRMEGARVTKFGDQLPTRKVAGHDVGSCNCRLCSNLRYKERKFRETDAKKPLRARKERHPRILGQRCRCPECVADQLARKRPA